MCIIEGLWGFLVMERYLHDWEKDWASFNRPNHPFHTSRKWLHASDHGIYVFKKCLRFDGQLSAQNLPAAMMVCTPTMQLVFSGLVGGNAGAVGDGGEKILDTFGMRVATDSLNFW